MSVTFINFIHNATNAILPDGWYVLPNGSHLILDNALIHHTFARDVVEPYLSDLGITYTFLPKYSCDLNPVESFHEIESNIEEKTICWTSIVWCSYCSYDSHARDNK